MSGGGPETKVHTPLRMEGKRTADMIWMLAKPDRQGAEGDSRRGVLMLEGEVRAYLLSEEGREVTLFSLGAGDPCVLSASTRPPSSGGTA